MVFLILGLALIIVLLFVVMVKQTEQLKLKKAQLFFEIQQKLDKNEDFKKIERILDDSDSPDFEKLLADNKEGLDEYLRFFESLIVLNIPNQFSKEEAKMLFGRSTELLSRHFSVRNYIKAQNYQYLDTVLAENSAQKEKQP